MSAERDIHDILDTRLRDVPQLRPTFLGDVLDQTRTIPQRRNRWPHPDRGFTMFSALKFAAASVIVALFGGFLLAGVLTAPQGDETVPAAMTASPEPETTTQPTESSSPSIRTDILPGVELTVEEVEPRVYQVVDDGVRDLASKNDIDIVAGHDGGIWLLRHQRFFRLGSDTAYAWATKKPTVSDFEVAPGGTVWTRQTPRGKEDLASIQSFDGKEWTTHQKSWWGGPRVEVTPDGTVWATWEDPEQGDPVFGYLDEDGWQVLGDNPVGSLHVASPDSIWGTGGVGSIFSSYLYRFVDGAWQRWVTMEGNEPTWQPAEDPLADNESFPSVAVGPEGTFWGIATFPNRPNLVRFDGSGWSRWPGGDTFWPTGSGAMGGSIPLDVHPDGSVWYATLDDDPSADPNGRSCGGVRRFDGVTWDRYLPGLCVNVIDIAADGSVWVLAIDEAADSLDEGFYLVDKKSDRNLYVITPEAVAAPES